MSDNPSDQAQAHAWQAARLGESLIAAVRADQSEIIEPLLRPGSPAALLFELFGSAWLRLDLRLDDPRENGQLAPYDLQTEGDLGLLELAVLTSQPETTERGHFFRLFGSGLLLQRADVTPSDWQIVEVLPVNSDGQLRPDDPVDAAILAFHQGRSALPLRSALPPTERLFLPQMQSQGRFNLEEQLNAVRLGRDYTTVIASPTAQETNLARAAAIEYLITLFDYHQVAGDELAARYGLDAERVTDQAREIAATLGVTQFDDRYTIHPDPIAHYRELFGELGIDPRRDEAVRLASGRPIFDSIEVPPDDDTFFGPS